MQLRSFAINAVIAQVHCSAGHQLCIRSSTCLSVYSASHLLADSQLVDQLVAGLESQVSLLNEQEGSNTLWALATLYGYQHSHDLFIQALVEKAGGRLSGFKPQGLSHSLWALATLYESQHCHRAFIQAWMREQGAGSQTSSHRDYHIRCGRLQPCMGPSTATGHSSRHG